MTSGNKNVTLAKLMRKEIILNQKKKKRKIKCNPKIRIINKNQSSPKKQTQPHSENQYVFSKVVLKLKKL